MRALRVFVVLLCGIPMAAVLGTLFVAGAWADYQVTVGTNAVLLVASTINAAYGPARTNGQVYASGGHVVTIGGLPVASTIAGTGATGAVVYVGAAVADGTNGVVLLPVRTRQRRSLAVSNLGTNVVYLRFAETPGGAVGLPLAASGYLMFESQVPQGPVWAQTGGGTSSVFVTDDF
jgi:hypothetical protein